MKTRLMHVRANVRDLGRAIDWYRETLGFEVEDLWPRDQPIYAAFAAGKVQPSLSQRRNRFPPERGSTSAYRT